MDEIRILLGGSPCTKWSIARAAGRETLSSGEGWELFLNYKIAKEKFSPDLFLYENNKSVASAVKEEICNQLGQSLMYINSSSVSAQNRERFYVFNWKCDYPLDRHIMLADVLQDGPCNQICYEFGEINHSDTSTQVGIIKNQAQNQGVLHSKQYRVYSPYGKSTTMCGQGGGIGAKTGLYAVPLTVSSKKEMEYMLRTTKDGRNHFDFGHHSNVADGKSSCMTANMSKGVPYNVLTCPINQSCIGVPCYHVRNGMMLFNGELHRVKLPDNDYIIRKLTPIEVERLQTMPDNYTNGVSATQRYRCLGNGWTSEVIIHILNAALEGVPRDTKIKVLSMYDGIGTGRYCLDKMGFSNIEYHAYEIDKYAIKIALNNYPDIIQHGNAFAVRNDDWSI